jgi:hypothetical protein
LKEKFFVRDKKKELPWRRDWVNTGRIPKYTDKHLGMRYAVALYSARNQNKMTVQEICEITRSLYRERVIWVVACGIQPGFTKRFQGYAFFGDKIHQV